MRDTLAPYASSHDYTFIGRIKKLESISEKIETGRFFTWSELDDLYACTIVVPVSSHELGVVRKLEACFERVDSKSRESTEKAPEVFRYDGLRWYGRVRSEVSDARQPGLSTVVFEVQVRTAFEHAWQVVTHDLVYKTDNVEWSRQRLAAQLKAGVEQIETVIDSFEQAAGAVRTSPWSSGALQSSVIAFFRQLETDSILQPTLVPASWRRFSENFVKLAKAAKLGPDNEQSVQRLLDLVNENTRGRGTVVMAVSGSLLQFVYAVLASEGHASALGKLSIADSTELHSIYGLAPLSRKFVFDDFGGTTDENSVSSSQADQA